MAALSAVVYCRISKDSTGLGVGVERQRADCVKLADSLGWSVAEVFTDNDVSAYSGKPRPEYRRMLDKLRNGQVGAVLAWHTDRLYRSIPDLSELIEICDDKGVEIRTVKAGEVDLSTPSGRLSATMFASIARYEVERSAERIRAAKDEAARAGRYRGGVRPFGYMSNGVDLEPTEAQCVREAAQAVLAGASLMSIARDWNAAGITSTQGRRWTVTTVRSVVSRARNAALVESKGQIVGPAQWEPIFDADTLNAVRAVISDPSRRKNVSIERRHQGTGVYRCGKCGGLMRRIKQRYGHEYQCRDNYHVSVKADALDELVSSIAVQRLSQPDIVELLHQSDDGVDLAQIQQQRAGFQARKDELAAMFSVGDIDGSQLRRGSTELQSRIDKLDAQIAQARQSTPIASIVPAEDVAEQWHSLSADIRGKIIDALMTVEVMPTGTGSSNRKGYHVGERVKVEWK